MDPTTIIFAVALVAFLLLRLQKGRRSPAQIAAMQAAVADGGALVDVRSPGEYAAGHPKGAINLPLPDVTARAAELGAKDRKVVVFCASGARSAAATRLLMAAGYDHVMDLGSWRNWPGE